DQRTRRPITGAAPQPRVRSRPSQGCSTAVPVRENRPHPAWLPPDRSQSGKPEKGRLVPLNVDPALQERPMRVLLAQITSARAADDRSVRPSKRSANAAASCATLNSTDTSIPKL